jgi:hypothetical protein
MFNARSFKVCLVIFLLASGLFAQYKPAEWSDPAVKIFPVSALREGMRGTAKSVFRGSVPEEFGVEILGVIPNWIGPKQDMIVGKLSGANAERTFVFAGMSGSPVYIDGKLVGAISYSFPFAKEPICGITPFEQMASAVEKGPAASLASSEPKSFTYAELTANDWRPSLTVSALSGSAVASGFASDSRLMAIAGQTFKPIATPVTFSGISQKVLDLFAPQFEAAGILPVAAAGGNTGITPTRAPTKDTLLGGNSIVVQLARGDVQIAAAGTVTLRDGDKIYAFGHPFFGLGSTSMPMSESHVVTVVPNANNSFKLAVADATVGAMTQDRATGIYGLLGESPRMLPVRIRIKTTRGRGEEINFESAVDDVLTPLIVNAGVANAILANERGFGDLTIDLTGEITLRGQAPIKLGRRFVGQQSTVFAASAATVPLAALLRANFEGADISGITLDMTMMDGSKTAILDRISADKTQVHPGDTVNITALERTAGGLVVSQSLSVTIPRDTAPGPLTLIVADGAAAQQASAITQFTPRTAAEFISTFNRLKRPDRLYAIVARTSAGVVVGASEMPNLPPSVLATMNNDRTAGGSKAIVQTIVAEAQVPAGEFVVSGSQTLSLEVIR